MKPKADIGVFGGSGFYELLTSAKEINVKTPYGFPSDKITLGEYRGKKVAFLPRHGKNHHLPPHKIPYQANVYAFKMLGITRILAPCAAGSLKANLRPGDFVLPDSYIDRTHGRIDTFYQGKDTLNEFYKYQVAHISPADPYCPQLRALALSSAKTLKIRCHDGGTMVICNGPRFSTRAESKWFSGCGWDTLNMTGYPEAVLAQELGICYLNISLITDYDIGLAGTKDIKPVNAAQVVSVFQKNNVKVKEMLFEIIDKLPAKQTCECVRAIEKAGMS